MVNLRRKMSILCMKTRTCLLFATCIVGAICVTFLWLVGDEDVNSGSNSPRRGSWNILVSQTHQHLRDLQENSHQRNRLSEADPYLRLLGFEPDDYSRIDGGGTKNIRESGDFRRSSKIDAGNEENSISSSGVSAAYVQTFTNFSSIIPLIAVPVQSGQTASAWDLFNSLLLHAPAHEWLVYFYDLGLGYYEKSDLITRCKNASGVLKKAGKCQLRRIDWSLFPAHISQYKLEAYRPLIIQDALNVSGAVFYLSPQQRFRDLVSTQILDKARRLGVYGWRLDDDSTSAVTHPKSFAFFDTDPQHYYFHHTIRGDRLLVYNTPTVRDQLVFPWLQCALTLRCVSPVGAQDTGCRLFRKPLYLYSGCHRYDVSIMNVVLGLLFRFDSASYTIDFEGGKFVSAQSDLLTRK